MVPSLTFFACSTLQRGDKSSPWLYDVTRGNCYFSWFLLTSQKSPQKPPRGFLAFLKHATLMLLLLLSLLSDANTGLNVLICGAPLFLDQI